MTPLFRYTTARHLARAKLRTALTMVGIALGVALYVAIRLCNDSVSASFRDTMSALSGAATLEVVGGQEGLDEAVYATVAETPGVTAVAPIIQRTVALEREPSVSLTIVGIDPFSEAAFRADELDGGPTDPAEPFLLDPTAVLLTRSFAHRHGLAVGQTIRVVDEDRAVTLTVAGLLPPGRLARAQGGGIALMDIASAQWTLGRLGTLDRIDILTDPAAVDTVSAALQRRLPAGLTLQRPERRLAHAERVVRSFQVNLTALSGIALLVGLFLIYNTMTYAWLRRRAEIGLLRALGVTRRRLFALLAAESLAFGAVGGLIGVPLGALLAWAALGTVSRTVEALYQGAPAQTIALTPALAAEGLALGCAVAVVAAMIPIWEALHTVPREVLHAGWVERRRHLHAGPLAVAGLGWFALAAWAAQAGPVNGIPLFGYAAALFVVLGGTCLAPLAGLALARVVDPLALRLGWVEARIAGGTLASTPGRTAVAAGALMTALAMMVSVIVMVGSFRRTVERWIAETISADMFVTPAARAAVGPSAHFPDDSVVTVLRAVPGVAAVDPYRQIPIQYSGHPILVSARDLTLVAQRSTVLFERGDPPEMLRQMAAGAGVAVSEVLARSHGLRAGGVITLPAPAGPVTFPIVGVFFDYATDGGRVLMDRSAFSSHWKDSGVTAAAVYLDPGADIENVRTAITRALTPLHRVTMTSNRELKREVLEVFDQTFAITRALDLVALAVAMLGVANTVLAIVLERRREIGVLRALGTTRRQIGRIVVCEAGLIGLVGTVLGAATGFGVALILIRVVNVQSFGWTIRFWWGPTEVLAAAGLAFAAALAAGWLPARHAARSPLVEVLTDE
ncbi:MAG: ABC transporter permease [Nitrospirae bacterium]|nr:ABC transporter permease [Nitrospirota bacterium]